MNNKNLVGKIVYATSGRDKGKMFVVITALDKNFVSIVDGDIRKIEKPKKKKVKHLIFTDKVCEDIVDDIFQCKKFNNAKIKKSLEAKEAYEEV